MRLVLLGPPGAGKGTQAEKLARHYGVPHVATGDMLRDEVAKGTELGKRAAEYMHQGVLVPDELVREIVRNRLSQPECSRGFVLDGYPRNVKQARMLEEDLCRQGLTLNAVVFLSVPTEVLVSRSSGRVVCSACGANYNVVTRPPRESGKCDRCGGRLIHRQDDQEDTVRKRLEVYQQESLPVRDFYAARGLLRTVDGDQPVEEVFRSILEAVGGGDG